MGLVVLAVVFCLGMEAASSGHSGRALALRALVLAVSIVAVLWLGLLEPSKRVLRSLSLSNPTIPMDSLKPPQEANELINR
jgi:hypothetical protein